MKNDIYKLIEYTDAPPGARAVYEDTMKTLGLPFVLNWFKCQGNNEQILAGNWAKLKSTLMMGNVPNIIKQLIIYNVSTLKGCDYCSQAHGIFANMMGRSLHPSESFRATEHLDSELLPHSYRIAIQVVTRAALQPASLTDGDFAALSAAGYSDADIKELLSQADLVNMLNTIADISGIRLDRELLELAG